jgi:uncharacterized protein
METSELSIETKRFVASLARNAIISELDGFPLETGKVPDEAERKAGTFVTLTLSGLLRGCMGQLDAHTEIYRGVIENARLAAFHDARFDPLRKDELDKISIQVSILSPLREIVCEDPGELCSRLGKEKPGVVLEADGHRATFLPHVWEELDGVEEFLSTLCSKAGLPPMYWRDRLGELTFQTYSVDSFSEGNV